MRKAGAQNFWKSDSSSPISCTCSNQYSHGFHWKEHSPLDLKLESPFSRHWLKAMDLCCITWTDASRHEVIIYIPSSVKYLNWQHCTNLFKEKKMWNIFVRAVEGKYRDREKCRGLLVLFMLCWNQRGKLIVTRGEGSQSRNVWLASWGSFHTLSLMAHLCMKLASDGFTAWPCHHNCSLMEVRKVPSLCQLNASTTDFHER